MGLPISMNKKEFTSVVTVKVGIIGVWSRVNIFFISPIYFQLSRFGEMNDREWKWRTTLFTPSTLSQVRPNIPCEPI